MILNPPYKRLERNRYGRDLVIGDIHGHFTRVERELDRVGFDPGKDRLICVGDLADRGPESVRAIEWLKKPWFFAVMGNHDASVLNRFGLLSARFELWINYHDWLDMLGRSEREELAMLFAALPWALEVETARGAVGIVHAEVPQRFKRWQDFVAALDDEEIRSLACSSRTLARQAKDIGHPWAAAGEPVQGIEWTIHGHTPRPGCQPGQLANRLWIDTRGWHDGPSRNGEPRFTLVDVNDPLTPL